MDSPVHATSDGTKALSNARGLVQRLRVLREAGLSPKAVFLILQTYGLSSLTHLQRANYESGRWVDDFDQVLFEGLEDLLGAALSEEQRSLAGLRFADGGLSFGGCRSRSASAFLASWALCLHQVAQLVGASWLGAPTFLSLGALPKPTSGLEAATGGEAAGRISSSCARYGRPRA